MERLGKMVRISAVAVAVAVAVEAFGVVIAVDTDAVSKAADFLKTVEGFRPTEYKDSAGKKTIGYGFTSAEMVGKGTITKCEASAELDRLCRSISERLRKELGKGKLTDNEEAAVVSFIYNVGWANFKASTMCRLLKKGKRGTEVSKEFLRWKYVTQRGKKVVCKGLQNRREKERRLFEG